jgi:hypothetical protein
MYVFLRTAFLNTHKHTKLIGLATGVLQGKREGACPLGYAYKNSQITSITAPIKVA